jgi:Phage integrase family
VRGATPALPTLAPLREFHPLGRQRAGTRKVGGIVARPCSDSPWTLAGQPGLAHDLTQFALFLLGLPDKLDGEQPHDFGREGNLGVEHSPLVCRAGHRQAEGLVLGVRNPDAFAHGAECHARARAVPLDDDVAASLDRLSRREHFTGDDDYVFCQETGEPLGYYWTTRRFKAARDAAKLTSPRAGDEPLTFHDLRHTYGTLAAAIYRNLRQVQEYVGHASITTTEIYAHFIPQADAAAMATAARRAMLAPSTEPSTNGAILDPTGAN